MCEILFRGKRVDNGEWIEGSLISGAFTTLGRDIKYILCPDKADYDCFEDFSEENGIFEVITETVGQYTSFTDKNGTKIFEGDIVRYEYIEGYVLRSVVKFGEYEQDGSGSEYPPIKCIGFCVVDCLDNCFDYMKTQNVLQTASECEVIGNIHENPELLDGAGNR